MCLPPLKKESNKSELKCLKSDTLESIFFNYHRHDESGRRGLFTAGLLRTSNRLCVCLRVWGLSQAALICSSVQPVRSDQPGGRRIATWLSSRTVFHRVWEVLRTSWYGTRGTLCSTLAGGTTRSDVTEDEPSSLEQGEPPGSLSAPVLLANVGAHEKLSSSWNARQRGRRRYCGAEWR